MYSGLSVRIHYYDKRIAELTEVVSIRFKSCGKNYYFSPEEMKIEPGTKVIVDTAKGLEMAECTKGNHTVEDEAVIQPLRSVVRIATAQDLRAAETAKSREKEAFEICRKKIKEHGLDMKLVGVECNFEGSKTLFFFTADGRVDFRELVKDLAGIFHNRIELRQIGVRDEAKLIGGIGICGRPYCCGQFLEDFAPVSTKMAKTQSLSLNPAKISGSCGRLMCCLRYEEDAYEDLLKKVPKQGAFVETVDGYGVAVQVNVLRQTVKVSLDGESDDSLHEYSAAKVAAVPGGRPTEGEAYPHVLEYRPEEEEEITPAEENDLWTSPSLFAYDFPTADGAEPEKTADRASEENSGSERKNNRQHGNGRNRQKSGKKPDSGKAARTDNPGKAEKTNVPDRSVRSDRKQDKKPDSKKHGENSETEKKHGNSSGKKQGEKREDPGKRDAKQNQPVKQRNTEAPKHENVPEGGESSGGKENPPRRKKPYYGKNRYYGNKKKTPKAE